MGIQISRRVAQLEPSETLAITAKAKKLRAEGKDVLGFGAGEPDFETPKYINDAAKAALDAGFTKYTPASGIDELRAAVADQFFVHNGVRIKPSQVLISCGAKHALANAMMALLQEGDTALVPAPYWVSIPAQIKLACAEPKILYTDESTGFKITPAQLKQNLSPDVKMIYLNSPNNPTGAVYTKPELEELSDILRSYPHVAILSDEIYNSLVYDNLQMISFLAIAPDLADRIIVFNGVSKSYSMTGWRIGWAIGPENVIAGMGKLQSQVTSNPTSFAQKGALAAITCEHADLAKWVAEFDRRRKLSVQGFCSIPDISCRMPEGAFYIFPKVSKYYGKALDGIAITGSASMCDALMERAGVALIPGAAFGTDEYLRFSYAASEDAIKKGISRIQNAFARMK